MTVEQTAEFLHLCSSTNIFFSGIMGCSVDESGLGYGKVRDPCVTL